LYGKKWCFGARPDRCVKNLAQNMLSRKRHFTNTRETP
jgi:hypothetical protein